MFDISTIDHRLHRSCVALRHRQIESRRIADRDSAVWWRQRRPRCDWMSWSIQNGGYHSCGHLLDITWYNWLFLWNYTFYKWGSSCNCYNSGQFLCGYHGEDHMEIAYYPQHHIMGIHDAVVEKWGITLKDNHHFLHLFLWAVLIHFPWPCERTRGRSGGYNGGTLWCQRGWKILVSSNVAGKAFHKWS